jgi:acetate kinase
MGGVDLIIFTGGIGENDIETRRKILEGLEFMGIDYDNERNSLLKGKELIVTRPGSKVLAMVMPTNEELVIAIDTYNIVTDSNLKF